MAAADVELEDNEDDEPLALEENEEAAAAREDLLSPPRGWPECFSKSLALKQYISAELGGTRVRLSEPPDDDHRAMAEAVGERDSALATALALRSRYGWDVLGGFALFERAASADSFVGEPHYWNANARGLWIDLTPRTHTEIVLVESPKTAVPPPAAGEAMRLEALRSSELAALERRDAERKAAKKAAKAAEKGAKEAEKAARRCARRQGDATHDTHIFLS